MASLRDPDLLLTAVPHNSKIHLVQVATKCQGFFGFLKDSLEKVRKQGLSTGPAVGFRPLSTALESSIWINYADN